jgi:hypothetical protein
MSMYYEKTDPLDLNATTLPASQVPLKKRLPYFLGKAINFIRRYRSNPSYLAKYLRFVGQGSYRESVRFVSDEAFVEMAKRRSTLRLQDGEFTLLLGTRDVSYEKKDERLTSMWKEAIRTYSDASPYMLGLPPYVVIDNKTLHTEGFKYLWMPAKILYRMWFPKDAAYFNGSYFYINNTSTPFMQSLSRGQDVILVSNSEVIGGVRPHASHFFKDAAAVSYVETPEKNASAAYDDIMRDIRKSCTPSTVIFMACGPAGKAMIYDLSKEGVLAHDIGYGLTGAYTGEEREHFLKWDIFGPLYYKAISHD